MKQIAPDVYLLEGLRSSNVYAFTAREGIALIDSGMSGAVDQIVEQLEESGYTLSDLQAVVLTHAHGDHTGNAAELVRRSEAQIWLIVMRCLTLRGRSLCRPPLFSNVC
jgi:glyoxylase-like metal-dependent hydrolase (beta-lactamase superfamily II)